MVLFHVDERATGIGQRKAAMGALLQQCEAGRAFRIEVDGLRRQKNVAAGNPAEMRLEGVELRPIEHPEQRVVVAGYGEIVELAEHACLPAAGPPPRLYRNGHLCRASTIPRGRAVPIT